jgi:hypothetical protein
MDVEPGIRTNTTICLGRISKHLSQGTRQKVLIPAFVRSLHDPFVPARNAGLLALVATLEYYEGPDIATKLLPNMCTLLVDSELPIRTQAFKNVDTFLKRLQVLAQAMPESAIKPAAPEAHASSGTTSTTTTTTSGMASSLFSTLSSVMSTGSAGTLSAGRASLDVGPAVVGAPSTTRSPAPSAGLASHGGQWQAGSGSSRPDTATPNLPSPPATFGALKLGSAKGGFFGIPPTTGTGTTTTSTTSPPLFVIPPANQPEDGGWGDFGFGDEADGPPGKATGTTASAFPLSQHVPMVPMSAAPRALGKAMAPAPPPSTAPATSNNQGWGDFGEEW